MNEQKNRFKKRMLRIATAARLFYGATRRKIAETLDQHDREREMEEQRRRERRRNRSATMEETGAPDVLTTPAAVTTPEPSAEELRAAEAQFDVSVAGAEDGLQPSESLAAGG
jgi:hypothetical protein